MAKNEEMTKKEEETSITDQLEEVSRMTEAELCEVRDNDAARPGIIRQFAAAILEGQIGDTLRIIKEVSKMRVADVESKEEPIEDLATGDDDEAFYEALIRQNVSQLTRPNASPQEVARLSQNINIFRKELREIRSRKPKVGSTLEKVLAAANSAPKAKKVAKKPKTITVKKKKTAPKAAGASKKKKTGKVPSGAKK